MGSRTGLLVIVTFPGDERRARNVVSSLLECGDYGASERQLLLQLRWQCPGAAQFMSGGGQRSTELRKYGDARLEYRYFVDGQRR